MKRSTLAILLLITLLTTAPLCHAGWLKDMGKSVGKVTRTVTDKGKGGYSKAKEYTDKNKGKWEQTARETYSKTKKAAGEARDGFRDGYYGKKRAR